MTEREHAVLRAYLEALSEKLDWRGEHEDERRKELERRIDGIGERVDHGFKNQDERLRKVEEVMIQRTGMAQAAKYILGTLIAIATAIGAFFTWAIR